MPALSAPASFAFHTGLSLGGLSILPGPLHSLHSPTFLRSTNPIPPHSPKSKEPPSLPRCYSHTFGPKGDLLHTAPLPGSKLLASNDDQASYILTSLSSPATLSYYSASSLLSTFTLDDEKLHGDLVLDDWFGGASLTDDYLIYTAYLPAPPMASHFTKAKPSDPADLRRGVTNVVDEGLYEDAGETYTGKPPRIGLFSLHLATGAVAAVECTPFYNKQQDGLAVAANHPCLSLAHGMLTYTVHSSPDPSQRSMGSVYCSNRPCGVYTNAVAALPDGTLEFGPPVHVSAPFALARGSRFSPAGDVVYFSSKAGFDQHNSAFALTVGGEQVTEEELFPLGFCPCEGEGAFSADGRLITGVNRACNQEIITIDIKTGAIEKPLLGGLEAGVDADVTSRSIIAVRDGHLVYKASSPSFPGAAVVAPLAAVLGRPAAPEPGSVFRFPYLSTSSAVLPAPPPGPPALDFSTLFLNAGLDGKSDPGDPDWCARERGDRNNKLAAAAHQPTPPSPARLRSLR
jgi:hypothetical protein